MKNVLDWLFYNFLFIVKCPICHGHGGYFDQDGSGPFNDCDYCIGYMKISVPRWVYWWFNEKEAV
jgi:hypothetical protein